MGVRRKSSRGGITGQWCYEGGYGGIGTLKCVEEGRVMKRKGEEREESNAKRVVGKSLDFLIEL